MLDKPNICPPIYSGPLSLFSTEKKKKAVILLTWNSHYVSSLTNTLQWFLITLKIKSKHLTMTYTNPK